MKSEVSSQKLGFSCIVLSTYPVELLTNIKIPIINNELSLHDLIQLLLTIFTSAYIHSDELRILYNYFLVQASDNFEWLIVDSSTDMVV